MTALKPGWCGLHGKKEPCPVCNAGNLRAGKVAALVLAFLLAVALSGCDDTDNPFRSCAAASSAGAAPLREGEAGYGLQLDQDRAGIACEQS